MTDYSLQQDRSLLIKFRLLSYKQKLLNEYYTESITLKLDIILYYIILYYNQTTLFHPNITSFSSQSAYPLGLILDR